MAAAAGECSDRRMETALKILADPALLGRELMAVLLLAAAAVQVEVLLLRGARGLDRDLKKQAWLRSAWWILLALELGLAADLLRTIVGKA